jgi:hypothetical protein
MSKLAHCIYVSTATSQFRESDVPELLRQARAKNLRNQLTGMLAYIEGGFFQILEGDESAVDHIYEAIVRDVRHKRVTRIIHEPIAKRAFGDWTMAFSVLDRLTAGSLLGESDFFRDATWLERLGNGRARKLLEAFRNGRWRAEVTGQHPVMAG